MGNVTQFPNLKAETREAMVAGLRLTDDAIEQGISEYDGIVIVGYYRETNEPEPFPFGLEDPELAWIGLQLQNWALTDHYESLDDE